MKTIKIKISVCDGSKKGIRSFDPDIYDSEECSVPDNFFKKTKQEQIEMLREACGENDHILTTGLHDRNDYILITEIGKNQKTAIRCWKI